MENFKKYFSEKTIGNIVVVCTAILFYLTVSNFTEIRNTISAICSLLSPFIGAFAIAFLLNLPLVKLEETIFSKFKKKRLLSILTIYFIVCAVIVALLIAVIPQLARSIISIANSIPGYIQSIAAYLDTPEAQRGLEPSVISQINSYLGLTLDEANTIALSVGSKFVDWSVSLGNFVVNLVIAIAASVYMLATKERLIFQSKKILFAFFKKEKADKIIETIALTNSTFSGFIDGKIMESIFLCAICFVVMLFLHPPYALLISVVIGLTNMIPYIGPFLGAIPSAIALFIISPAKAIVFIVFAIILQQFDNNILGPKILGDSTGLAPIWVLVSIVVGGGLFGLVGMIIGVPTFAVLINLFSKNLTDRLTNKNIVIDEENMNLSFK